MKQFFKIFLACLVALIVFWGITIAFGFGVLSVFASKDQAVIPNNAVLVLDMENVILEQTREKGPPLPGVNWNEGQGLYELVYALEKAETDDRIKGIYIAGGFTPNGFATMEELRDALNRFKKSGKFIWANSASYTNRGYEFASVADSVILNPAGDMSWNGMAYQTIFVRDLLHKVGVQPEVFYAGDYKSATEMFRLNKMSEPNREQVKEFIFDIYGHFLQNISLSRNKDTAQLHLLAENLSIASASDAVNHGLIDLAAYDDEMKGLMAKKINVSKGGEIQFVTTGEYLQNFNVNEGKTASDRIALLIAQGDIVDGKGGDGMIGSVAFRKQIEKLREDKKIKAVVLRVNSPGGSALASEIIWRELNLLKKEKPLVVSMGDYAASGGYYISCMADSIFAQPNTLTGSIGVFALLFDASELLNNKLGIHTDGVSTTSSADIGNPFQPLKPKERIFIQNSVDTIYQRFLSRVAEGRKMPVADVDSLGQGRVWSGTDAINNKLVDAEGGIQRAIESAARLAKLKEYRISVYPPVVSLLDKLLKPEEEKYIQTESSLRQTLGDEFLKTWKRYQAMDSWNGRAQTRLPFFVN